MVLTKHPLIRGAMLAFLVTFLSGALFAQGSCPVHKKAARAMQDIFGDHPVSTRVELTGRSRLDDHLHAGDCLFKIHRDGSTEGYLLSTSAKGRYDYFDYSILYSKELEVLSVVVSVYRSTHGAGICQKKWLSQFEGYQGGPLRLGSDIDGVSGGTLSAASIIEDMQRCHLLISAATGD